MDISKASNFERFIFDLLSRDASTLRELWSSVDKGGTIKLKDEAYRSSQNVGFISSSSKHQNRLDFIANIYKNYSVMIDTHTADGLKAAMDHLDSDVPMLVLETALPIKFEETIEEAIGIKPERPDDLKNIEQLDQRFEVFDNDTDQVKQFIESKN
jgi:threonine synthase